MSTQILDELSLYLEKTLSPDPNVRRPAEKYLEQMESNENFGPVLLVLCNKQDLALHLRISASVTFKNYIKRNWKVNEDCQDKITAGDRQSIKSSITDMMLTSPEQIQLQLSDAISIISREDFPEKWPDLLPALVERLKTGDFSVTNGILRTAHSIFKRYRHEFKSNELWTEIKYVLGIFALPLTELFKSLMGLVEQHSNDANAIKIIFSSVLLVTKIFSSLNAQDFPEEFENNMETWMSHFLNLLQYDNHLLKSQSKEAGLIEQVKSQICDNVFLFAQNYGEDFADYLPKFVTAVLNLLTSTGLETKYDLLVSNAIQFISVVAYRPQYRALFENEESLKSICEKIIIPNLFLRDVDIETIEVQTGQRQCVEPWAKTKSPFCSKKRSLEQNSNTEKNQQDSMMENLIEGNQSTDNEEAPISQPSKKKRISKDVNSVSNITAPVNKAQVISKLTVTPLSTLPPKSGTIKTPQRIASPSPIPSSQVPTTSRNSASKKKVYVDSHSINTSESEDANDTLSISQKESDQLNTRRESTKTDLNTNTTPLIHTPSKNVKLFLSKYKEEIESGGDLYQIFSIFEKQTIGDYVLNANRRIMEVPENYASHSSGPLTTQQHENKENVPKKITATVPHFAYFNDNNKKSKLIILNKEPPILPMDHKIFSGPELKKGFKYLPTEDSIFNFLAKEYLNNFCEKKTLDEQLAKSYEKFYLTNNYIYPLTEWIEIPYNFTMYENNGKANHKTYSLYKIIISVTARLWVLRYILHSYTDTPCYFSTRSKSMQQINSASISCRDCELCYQIQFNYRRNACRIYSNNPLFMHQHNIKIIYDKKKIV